MLLYDEINVGLFRIPWIGGKGDELVVYLWLQALLCLCVRVYTRQIPGPLKRLQIRALWSWRKLHASSVHKM